MGNPHAKKFIKKAGELVKKYDTPSNSKTSGMRSKVSDWKKKVKRAGIDFGRKVSKVWNRSKPKPMSQKKQYVTPGLRGKNRRFAERWVKGK